MDFLRVKVKQLILTLKVLELTLQLGPFLSDQILRVLGVMDVLLIDPLGLLHLLMALRNQFFLSIEYFLCSLLFLHDFLSYMFLLLFLLLNLANQ